MKDDAVAPVVAAMLVLAIMVTFFSVWNAVYLPSLKQQSEMTQSREIEAAFAHFSSDLTTAASLQRDLTLSEPMPMGGGGVMFSPLTSAGTLWVSDEPRHLYQINISDKGIPHRVTVGRLVNFSYRPVNDFWIDQGYVWHYGYVNVTRGSAPNRTDGATLATPLTYATMDDVKKSRTIKKFAESLIDIEASSWSNSSANCSHITLSSVTFQSEPDASYASSNGIGTLALASTVSEEDFGVPEISSPDVLVIRINRTQPEPFPTALYDRCNQSFARLNATYPYNIAHTFGTTAENNITAIRPISGRLPFTITYREVMVNVSVQ